jgi:two-component system OmpR family response regulator
MELMRKGANVRPEAASPDSAKTMLNHQTSSSMQRIFLVEDSPIIRESLVEVLSSEDDGRQVIGTAETEEDAFNAIATTHADVAIIDINLREGSGIGLLARLSQLDEAPPTRIVYTNHYSRRVAAHCAELGATHVLSKAGNLSELLDVLDHSGPHN